MLLAAVAVALQLGATAHTPIAISCSRLIDASSDAVLADAVIVVDGSRIVARGRRADVATPQNATRIELGGLTVVPGLIDAHVHLAWSTNGPATDVKTLAGAAEALTTLRAGFTTVRNLGSTGWADVELRDAI